MIEDLARDLATGFEGHFLRAVFISGALALFVTGVAAVAWWRGRRWVTNRVPGRSQAGPYAAFSREDPPPSDRSAPGYQGPADRSSSSSDEQPGARLVREAAARAAGLRDAWERSYREARSGETPPASAAPPELGLLIEQLLREQQETNALLRRIASQLDRPR